MTFPFVQVNNLSHSLSGVRVLDEISFSIRKGETWAIIGPSGSGKTTLGKALAGLIHFQGSVTFPSLEQGNHRQTVGWVEQQHHFKNLSNTTDFYYQQRFNSADAEQTLTVREALSFFNREISGRESQEYWIIFFHLSQLLDKPLIQLSNGENKRFQLFRIMLENPEFLILDNPFTGLDAEGREALHQIIQSLTTRHIQLLLICPFSEIPLMISHLLVLDKGKIVYAGPKDGFVPTKVPSRTPAIDFELFNQIPEGLPPDFDFALEMEGVTVQYGGLTILDNLTWKVRRGERWSISGPNGAGKSTLLSLITADNPQAYANHIRLFDKKRGSGESIWDIKRKIGYVSPELHLFFDQSQTCFQIIASGLFDTIGLFRHLSTDQVSTTEFWIKLFRLEAYRHKYLSQISTGMQRLVLLARALVKNPPLLILDEPCQGLDESQSYQFATLVNGLCEKFGTTLIYVSHYPKDIPACVTHSIKLESGKIVYST